MGSKTCAPDSTRLILALSRSSAFLTVFGLALLGGLYVWVPELLSGPRAPQLGDYAMLGLLVMLALSGLIRAGDQILVLRRLSQEMAQGRTRTSRQDPDNMQGRYNLRKEPAFYAFSQHFTDHAVTRSKRRATR